MTIVYTGERPVINIKGHKFIPNIPTFISNHNYDLIKNLDYDFEIYDENKKYDKGTVGIKVSGQLNFFLASLKTLSRLHEVYPTCKIIVECPDVYKFLLPKYCEHTNRIPKFERHKLVNFYDLHHKNPKMKLSQFNQSKVLIDSLLLQGSGLFDMTTDRDLKPYRLDRGKPKNHVCLFGPQSKLFDSIHEVLSQFDIKVKTIHSHRLTHIEETFSLLNCRLNIFTGEKWFDSACMSLYLHVNSLVFSHRPQAHIEELILSKFDNLKIALTHNWNKVYTDTQSFQTNINKYLIDKLGIKKVEIKLDDE